MADPTPVPSDDPYAGDDGAADGKWQLKQAKDGSYFLFDAATGQVKPADTGQLGLPELIKQTIPVTTPREIEGPPRPGQTGIDYNYLTEMLSLGDPRSQRSIHDARQRYIFGGMTQDDVGVLVAAGEITVEQASKLVEGPGGGGSGDALGWASLAYQKQRDAQELARQQERDKIGDTVSYLSALGNFQGVEDSRAAQRQAALAEAIPYALAPGTTHYAGFGLEDPAVKAGLVTPQRAQGVAFDPNSVGQGNQYDPQLEAAMAEYRALIGAV